MDMELDAIRQRDADYMGSRLKGWRSSVDTDAEDRHALLERIAKLERRSTNAATLIRQNEQAISRLEEDMRNLRAAARAVVEALRNPGEPDAVIKAIDALAAELEGSTGR